MFSTATPEEPSLLKKLGWWSHFEWYGILQAIRHVKGLTRWLPCRSLAGIAAVLTSQNMGLLPMGSRNIIVAPAAGKVARIRAVQRMHQNGKKKACAPIKSAVVYVDWNAHSVLHGI